MLDNAVRHAATRVEVAVTTCVDHDQAVISVSDDGPGIQPADRERVFERFTRLDDARGAARAAPASDWPSSVSSSLGRAVLSHSLQPRPPWQTRAELRLPLAPITTITSDTDQSVIQST